MRIENPFKPMSGKRPPELIGRDFVIDDFAEGLDNGVGAPGRLMRISGIRGMGKTVLLQELCRIARDRNWLVVNETASEGLCERVLQRVVAATAKPGLTIDATLRPSIQLGGARVTLGEAHVATGAVDSSTLRAAFSTYLETHREGLLIAIDEVQDASLDEIRDIAIAFQHEIGEERDIALVFAGLPSMISSIIEGKTLTFLRRALPENLKRIDALSVRQSFEDTFTDSGFSVGADEVERMSGASQGYPFMIQLVGYYTWQAAYRRLGRQPGVVAAEDVTQGIATAQSRFDGTVIEPALQRLPQSSIRYLVTMARCDRGGSARTSDIAERLGLEPSSTTSQRQRLIHEDIIEAKGRGLVSFVIPYLRQYLIDHADELL